MNKYSLHQRYSYFESGFFIIRCLITIVICFLISASIYNGNITALILSICLSILLILPIIILSMVKREEIIISNQEIQLPKMFTFSLFNLFTPFVAHHNHFIEIPAENIDKIVYKKGFGYVFFYLKKPSKIFQSGKKQYAISLSVNKQLQDTILKKIQKFSRRNAITYELKRD